ncbi:MAG: AsmA-like C-terminal region-containing protein, partial [Hyphomicrobium sp.]
PQVRGYTHRAGWSNQPLDLALLDLVDANANLSVVQLSYGGIKLDSTQVVVALKDRVVQATFNDVKLYKGRGNGVVMLNGTGDAAVLGANFALSGVAARPLLNDAAGMDWLAGTGNFTLSLAGTGRSEAALVRSLSGKFDLTVSDGALVGFNLGGALRDLSQGEIPDFSTSPTDKTDFSALTASFNITNGIAENNDLKLSSPLLRATGAGTVNLAQRTLNYQVLPKLVASLSGQGGQTDLSGIEIPVNITGPWDNPDISPDIAGALNSESTVEAVKSIGKNFEGKDAGEIVDDLFGKGKDGEPSKAQKLLDGFLGR